PPLLPAVAGEGGSEPEADEDAAGDVALDPEEAAAPLEPAAGGAGQDGVEAVADDAEGHEDQSEAEDLESQLAPGRIRELREERQEEERRLRVQDVDHDALREEPPEAPGRCRAGRGRRAGGEEPPDPQIDEVERPEVLDDVEREGGGDEERR